MLFRTSMFFKQFYLGCLAHASYLIGDGGEAVVVDPRRDVDEYIAEARAQELTIRWILETHLHADFVSGHRELAERTGGTIVFGEKARAAFPHRAVRDGEEIRLGGLVLRILATPGHTPESISILVLDPEPRLVLTGDTLFIGDVGRPDLAASPQGLTAADMAAQLYDSLHGKLLALPDSVTVYPAHGAGSLCGRNISSDTSSTIGVQRRTNYALHPMPKDEFVRMMTEDLPEAPAYFPRDVEINRAGASALPERRAPAAISPADVERLVGAGAVSVPLDQLARELDDRTPQGPVAIVCASGYRSSIAGSLLLGRKGVEPINVVGGTNAWIAAGYPTERPAA